MVNLRDYLSCAKEPYLKGNLGLVDIMTQPLYPGHQRETAEREPNKRDTKENGRKEKQEKAPKNNNTRKPNKPTKPKQGNQQNRKQHNQKTNGPVIASATESEIIAS